MNIDEPRSLSLIFGRRSVRLYAPGEIKEDLVKRMLEAAMAAPSAMTKDPWRFVVVRQQQILLKLAEALPGGKMLGTCALSILVAGDLDAALDRELSYLLQDCSAATQNLLLAAHALGLGACWVGVHPRVDSVRLVRQILSLPANIVPVAVISLGLPGDAPEPRTRYQEGYIRREHW